MAVHIDNLGIPPLAGICSYAEAEKLGYDVETNVMLLKRYNFVKTQLNQIFAAHLAKTAEWEVKCGFSLHLWLEAEHSAAIRKRISEMREPPLHLDKVPDERLKLVFDELIRSEDTVELLVGIYQVIKPEMIRALNKHLAETNRLADYVTHRILKLILAEEEEMAAWGAAALSALIKDNASTATAQQWKQHIQFSLVQAGGIPNDLVPTEMNTQAALLISRSNGTEYKMDAVPTRDARFKDCFNQAAKIDEYYQDDQLSPEERTFALLFKRIREMDVPEWMGPILYKTKGKSWDYYLDMSRQLWDEARHAMMGEVGLNMLGVPFYQYPISVNASTLLNEHFTPVESHLILWGIEQGLMKKETGKRWEWTIAKSSNIPLAGVYQDYDWADEVLHAQIGRKWLAPDFGSLEDMLKQSKLLIEKWFTLEPEMAERSQQINWWPVFIAGLNQASPPLSRN
jgi:bacterioferritin (cytochrome b1)